MCPEILSCVLCSAGKKEITYISYKLGLPLAETLQAWQVLVKYVLKSNHWGNYRRTEYASSFGLHF
jgi:hypothetical protein